ncbi:MAG: hypothetical protein KDC93_18545 [Cyclobacteriaceae bacterium]|nr:hypothetical protein [Cyclobacteriaceae bacterium]
MKNSLYYFLGLLAFLFVLIKYIIPTILEWQQNEHNHQREIVKFSMQLENVRNNKMTAIQKVVDFASKTLGEIIPGMTSKIIGGL